MKKKKKAPTRRTWVPLKRGTPNPRLFAQMEAAGERIDKTEVWWNDLYQVTLEPQEIQAVDGTVVYGREGLVWLRIKTHDRRPIRDWRHLQQIKNEVMGPEREACEIFPAESRLVDTSNEFHLFVLPEGDVFPWGYRRRDVETPERIDEYNAESRRLGTGPGLARQRPWQPGLTTGQGGTDGSDKLGEES